MKMILKNFYKNNFIFIGKEKLSKFSILAILFLDIVVLMTIYQGINFQTNIVNNPLTTFPYKCRDVVSSNTLENFNSYSYGREYYGYDSTKYQDIKDLEVDSRCNIISEKIASIKDKIDIQGYGNKYEQFDQQEYKLNYEINLLKANYNTILFEKMSNQESSNSIIEGNLTAKNIKNKYNKLNLELDNIKKQKENLNLQFKEEELIKDLVLYIGENKTQFFDDIEKAQKYYYIKYELVILIFLIPLIVLFFYLMKKNLLNEKYVPYIIFKNIFLISSIPAIQSIYRLVNIFIPKIFVEKLLMFFYTLEIPFVVYYFAIGIFVFIFIFIVVKLQARFRNDNEKLKNNSISFIESYNKNICLSCGNRVDFNTMNFCPCCKNQLKTTCSFCENQTIKNLSYCCSCGENL